MKITMKLLVALIGAAMLITSCSRDQSEESTQGDGEQQLVTFGIKSFTQSVKPMRAASEGSVKLEETHLDKFIYMLYRKTSTGYASINLPNTVFTRDEGNLPESISLLLHKGDYRIVAAAFGVAEMKGGSGEVAQAQGGSFYVSTSTTSFYSNLYGYAMNSDLFYAAADFTVSNATAPQTLTLKRIVGRLDIEFVNGFTEETDRVKFASFANNFIWGVNITNLSATSLIRGSSSSDFTIYTMDMKTNDKGNPCVSLYYFGEDVPEGSAQTPMYLTMSAYKAGEYTPLASVTLRDESNTSKGIIPIYRSKVTTVSGKLFGENVEFEIDVDNEAWENSNNGDPIEF